MNIFDDMPDIPPCPKCSHSGEGLQWAFPDDAWQGFVATAVQCACLACGFHAARKPNYAEAIGAFKAGEADPEADDMNEITVGRR